MTTREGMLKAAEIAEDTDLPRRNDRAFVEGFQLACNVIAGEIRAAAELPDETGSEVDVDAETGTGDDKLPGTAEQWRDGLRAQITDEKTDALVARLMKLADWLDQLCPDITSRDQSVADLTREAAARIEALTERVEALENALDEIIPMHAHYAELLNEYDGGKRVIFNTKEEWMQRLSDLAARAALEGKG